MILLVALSAFITLFTQIEALLALCACCTRAFGTMLVDLAAILRFWLIALVTPPSWLTLSAAVFAAGDFAGLAMVKFFMAVLGSLRNTLTRVILLVALSAFYTMISSVFALFAI